MCMCVRVCVEGVRASLTCFARSCCRTPWRTELVRRGSWTRGQRTRARVHVALAVRYVRYACARAYLFVRAVLLSTVRPSCTSGRAGGSVDTDSYVPASQAEVPRGDCECVFAAVHLRTQQGPSPHLLMRWRLGAAAGCRWESTPAGGGCVCVFGAVRVPRTCLSGWLSDCRIVAVCVRVVSLRFKPPYWWLHRFGCIPATTPARAGSIRRPMHARVLPAWDRCVARR